MLCHLKHVEGSASMIRWRHLIPHVLVSVLVLLMFFLVSPCLAGEKTTLTFSWSSNVGPLNPHLYSPNQMFAQAMVYEPLVKYSEKGTVIPWLATSWKLSPDGTVYTFQLRKGVVFSDGTPFDAAAVKKNFDAILLNAKRHAWLEFVAQIKETSVVDAHTFQLTLRHPYYPALQELALNRPARFLVPWAIPESGNTAEGIKKPIGTGPWVLVESRLGEFDRFVRNNNYWGSKPAFATLLIKVIPDANTRAAAFEAGEVDLLLGSNQIALDTFKRYREDRRYTTAVSPPLLSRVVALNTRSGPTRDLAVRKAILHAVDKDALVRGVFLDTERRADTLFAPTFPYCDVKLAPYAFDPGGAEALLDKAGWTRAPGQTARSKAGEPLAIDLVFLGNDPVTKAISEVLQGDLRKIGIQVNLLGQEADAVQKRHLTGEFGMTFNETWGAPYDPHSFVSSMRVPSHADYQAQLGLAQKAEVDAKIGEVLVSTDRAKRQRLYTEILTLLHEQAVYLPISYQVGTIVHRPDLTGVTYGATAWEFPFEKMGRKP
jgi:nickel transport system substrate-binding protein